MEIPAELLEIKNISIRQFYKLLKVSKTFYPDYTIAQIMSLTDDDINDLNRPLQKKVRELMSIIQEQPDSFMNYYKLTFEKKILPFNYDNDKSIGESILSTINDIISLLYSDKEIDQRNAQIIQMYFSSNPNNIYSRTELAEIFNLDSERIRQIIFDSTNLKQILRGEEINLTALNPSFLEQLKNLKTNSLYNSSFEESIAAKGTFPLTLIEKLADTIDCEYFEIDNQFFLVKNGEVNLFREHYRALTQSINSEFLPHSKDFIYELVKKKLKSKISLNIEFIDSLLENCSIIENIEIENNENYFQCKWEYLFSILLKARRIIYESENQQLDRKSILDEFNRRESQLNMELTQDIQLVLKRGEGFSAQANGVWRYSTDSEYEATRRSLKSILEEFIIRKNGKVRFIEVQKFLNENNYIYPVSSIRSTLTDICLIAKKDRDLFVLESLAAVHSEIELTPKRQKDVANRFINSVISVLQDCPDKSCKYTELIKEVNKELAKENIEIKSNSNKINYLKKMSEVGIINEREIDDRKYIELDDSELEKHNLSTIGKQVEPEYKTNIRSLAINYLKEKPNFECSLKELRDEFIQFVKEGIKENIFYKIFNDSDYFVKTTDGNNKFISLNPALLPEPKIHTEDVLEPTLDIEVPEIDKVQAKTKEQLAEIYQLIPFNWEGLKKQMKTELGDYGFTSEALEIGINKFYEILGAENMGRWEQSIFKSINDFWFKSTDFFDRESYVIKLAHGFETYLKSFKEVPENTNGIADVVSIFPEMESLKTYKNIYKTLNYREVDNQKRNFSYILGNTIYLGNKLRHDAKDESLNMGVLKQAKTITDIAALYVYTACLLSK
jgi:hypothetical protein